MYFLRLSKQLFLVCLMALVSLSAYAENPRVLMQTSQGDITLELYPEKAPITVKNFLRYVDEDFYSGIQFHRVISDFMIQAGGFDKEMQQKPGFGAIKNESQNGLSNKKATIAMARTNDPDSATSQFFINLVDNLNLNAVGPREGYAVFGQVIKGMDVVEKIGRVKTTTKYPFRDVPVEPIIIVSVKRL